MHSNSTLPIVLVSANNSLSACKILSDLIEEEIHWNNSADAEYRIWRLVNKYYRADVRLLPLADGDPPPEKLAELVEAHIILLNSDESEEYAERRLVAAGEASRGSHVKLLLTEGAECPALLEWACRRRYELVALQPPAAVEDAFEDDVGGLARARAALHAHTWKGLIRLDRPDQPIPVLEGSTDSDGDSCDSWGSWQGGAAGGEAGGAAGDAEALGRLVGALGERRAALGALPDELRRRRAADLLACFCAALDPQPPPRSRKH